MDKKKRMKYFLRGLGMGIVFTTVLFTIGSRGKSSDSKSAEMTKEEIIKQAKEYGMVEQMDQKLDELDEKGTMKPEETVNPTGEPADTKTPEPTKVADATNTPKPTEAPKETEAPKDTEKPKETDASAQITQKAYATIEVESGNDAYEIANKLNEAGVVEDKAEFINYLIDNKYAKKIQVGTYQIAIDATYKQIARMLTSGY